MATLLSFCQWLGDTSFSIGIRESTWIYPVIESVHVLSLCVFVGLLLLWDLRLVGVGGLVVVDPVDHAGRGVDGSQRGVALRVGSGQILRQYFLPDQSVRSFPRVDQRNHLPSRRRTSAP